MQNWIILWSFWPVLLLPMAIPVLGAEIAFFPPDVSMTEQKFDYLDICSKLRGNCLGNEKEKVIVTMK